MTDEFGTFHPRELLLMVRQQLMAATTRMEDFTKYAGYMCDAVMIDGTDHIPAGSIDEAEKATAWALCAVESAIDALNQVKAAEAMLQTIQEASQRTGSMSKGFGAAIAAAKERYGSNNPRLAFVYEVSAEYFKQVNVPEVELRCLESAAEARRGAHVVKPEVASRQLALADTLNKLAAAYANMRKHRQAADAAEEALYHYRATLPADDLRILDSRLAVAFNKITVAVASAGTPELQQLYETRD